MKNKSFANFFTKENLENSENIEEFFIATIVYIPLSFKRHIKFDENLAQFLPEKEAEEKRKKAESPITTNSFEFNPNLINEIYNSFLIEKTLFIDDFVEHKIDNIRMLIKLAHNQKRKREIIEKHLKKCAKKIAEIDLSEDLFHLEDHIDLISESSINLIKNSINLDLIKLIWC